MTGNSANDPNLGRRLLDQFVLVEHIGGGGMGDVYLAEQPTMGRRAVVKLLHAELSRDPQIAARFNLEARALAALSHPHVVTVYNYGADAAGALFLAMEFLDGKDLEAVLREAGTLAPARAVAIAVQICAALGAAHARGVVHRDLKPSNVMLVGPERDFVKVLDFGVAKVRGVALTAAGTVFGTPEYMSPEQLRGESLDGRCDLYSLAVMIYELIAGRLPFVRDTPEAYMAAHLHELPPALDAVAPAVSPSLAALLARALAKDREARPASAEEMAELLQAALEDAPATAVGGKQSDRQKRRAGAAARGLGAGLRAALVGGVIGLMALLALLALLLLKRPPAPRLPTELLRDQEPLVQKKEQTVLKEEQTVQKQEPPPETAELEREAARLEQQFLTMPSRLRPRERRAALQALYARVDAAPGTAAEHARMRVEALAELIRQQAK
jgi:serine/threonine-protein kinase